LDGHPLRKQKRILPGRHPGRHSHAVRCAAALDMTFQPLGRDEVQGTPPAGCPQATGGGIRFVCPCDQVGRTILHHSGMTGGVLMAGGSPAAR
jgi:hypothetical protein